MADEPEYDLSDPTLQSVIASDPEHGGKPFWTLADRPSPEFASQRFQDFYRTHAIAGRTWDETAANFQQHFGIEAPDKSAYEQWVQRAPRERQLDQARYRVGQEADAGQIAGLTPGVPAYLGRAAISPIRGPLTALGHAYSNARIEHDEADPQDYRNVALYEHEQGLAAEQPPWAKVAGMAAALPGQIATLGYGKVATAAALGIPAVAGAAAESGQYPYDPRAIAKGGVETGVQLALLHGMGGVGAKLFPNAAQQAVGRVGAAAIAGVPAQAVADLGAHVLGLSEHYGWLQDALEGRGSEAARGALGAMLQFGAFQAAAGNPEAGRKAVESSLAEADRLIKGGVRVSKAVETVATKPEAVQPAQPEPQPIEPGSPQASAAPQAAQPSPPAVPEAAPQAPAAPAGPTPETVETMRLALKSLGLNSGKWSAEKVMTEATRLKITGAAERPGGAAKINESVQASPAPQNPTVQNWTVEPPDVPLGRETMQEAARNLTETPIAKGVERPDTLSGAHGEFIAEMAKNGDLGGNPDPQKQHAEEVAVRSGRNVPLEGVFESAGLSAKERHVVRERMLARSHEDVAGDEPMRKKDGSAYSRQRVKQIEQRALEKLGLPADFSLASLHEGERADRALDLIEKGGRVSPAELSGQFDPESGKLLTRKAKARVGDLDAAADRADKLVDEYIREAENNGGPISADRQRFWDERFRRVRAGLPEETPGAQGQPASGPEAPAQRGAVEPPPVRREPGPGVPGGPTAPAAAEPPAVRRPPAAAHAGGEAADAGRPQATRDQLARQVIDMRRMEAKMRGQGRVKDADQFAAQAEKLESRLGEAAPEPAKAPNLESAFHRQWAKAASEQGHDPADLHALAREFLDRNTAALDPDRAATVAEAWGRLAWFGVGPRELKAAAKQQKAAELPGMDEVGGDLKLGGDKTNPSDALAELLLSPKQQPLKPKDAYQHALDELNDRREARRATEEARRSGFSPQAAEEALRSGQEDGAAENAGGLGDAAGGDADDAHAGSGDFDFGANAREPGERPGATVPGPRIDPYQKLAEEVLADQTPRFGIGGGLIEAMAKQAVDTLKDMGHRLKMGYRELAGAMGPRTTEQDRESGEALARFNASPVYAKFAARDLIDKVLGSNATDADRRAAGAIITERRLRFIRDAYQAQGDQAAANAVKTIVGQPNSPLATEADYQNGLKSPFMQGVFQRFKQHVVPLMNDFYRRAQGLDDTDPIESFTQIPGEPVNLKGIREGDTQTATTVFTIARGNLKNPKQRPSPFARQATGASEGYDIDLGAIIENSMRGATFAAKAELYDTLKEKGLAIQGQPGQRLEGSKEIPGVFTGKRAGEGASLYVREPIYDELRKALAVDQPVAFPVFKQVSDLLTRAALASTVEGAYHTKNNLTFLMKPGIRPADLIKNAYGVIAKTPEVSSRLVELARIGAMKDSGISPEGGGRNPFLWTGKFIESLGQVMRLTAEDAFNRLRGRGLVIGSETNKRDFINQLGQYNKRAQNDLVSLLRDTGVGPFATAGTNYTVQGIRSLTMNPGAEATSPAAAVQLRAEMLGKTAAVLAGVALANYFLHKRADGDDLTPLGAVKVGDTSKGGSEYIDLGNLIGLKRGARMIGLTAVLEGQRKGKPEGKIADQARDDVVQSLMHPSFGPFVQFAKIAATGKDTGGYQVAEKAKKNESQAYQDMKAALEHANPLYQTFEGQGPREKKMTTRERLMRLLGPFGVQFREPQKRK